MKYFYDGADPDEFKEVINKGCISGVTTNVNFVVDYATKKSAKIILRGLRAISDFEYEVQLASMNRSMQPDIESVFMSPSDEYSFLSSSIVKDIARHGGDLSKFVHPSVLSELIKKFN